MKSEQQQGEMSPKIKESLIEGFKKFRKAQDFAQVVSKKVLVKIPVRKPNKTEYFRANDFEFSTLVLETDEPRETYLVMPELYQELGSDLKHKTLVLCVNRSGNVFLWPLNISEDGRSSGWNDSAMAAANLAKKAWVRVRADMAAQSYDVFEAEALNKNPEFPDLSEDEIMNLAFKGKIIDDLEHPAIQRLRGRM